MTKTINSCSHLIRKSHKRMYNKIRIRNSAEIFLVLTKLSTNFAQVVIKVITTLITT